MISFSTFALATVSLMVCVLYALDSLALLSRIRGAICGEYAIFNHVGMVLLVFNRVVTALVLPLIGFQIDTGIGAWKLSGAYFASSVLLVGVFVLFVLRPSSLFQLIVSLGARLGWRTVPDSILGAPDSTAGGRIESNLKYKAAAAQLFFILGFCLPSMAAATFPDFRATLLQLGFLLNSLGTIINIFFVERDIAAASRPNSETRALMSTAATIFLGRAWASGVSAGIFLVLALMLR